MAHTRWLGLGFAVWLLASSAFAQGVLAPGGGQLGSITVQEEDGSPTVSGVNKLKFANGSVTNNGDGSASIAGVSGLASTDIDTSLELKNIVTDETGSGALVFGTAPTLSAPVITTKANFPRVTAMPGTPSAGDTVIVTDDSAAGACDSAAGSATTLCQYNGSAWVALGDGNSGSGAPTNATYIVQTANGSLSNEQALGALSTGCLGSATTTGVVSARTITGTGAGISYDCTPAGSVPCSYQNKFYNNVLYNMANTGFLIGEFYAASSNEFKNNIVHCSTTSFIPFRVYDTGDADNVITYNRAWNCAAISNSGTNTTLSNNTTGTPSFTNAAGDDFTLQSGSDARDAGTDVSAAGVTVDFLGAARKQGSATDLGAYEYPVSTQTGGFSGTTAFSGSVRFH